MHVTQCFSASIFRAQIEIGRPPFGGCPTDTLQVLRSFVLKRRGLPTKAFSGPDIGRSHLVPQETVSRVMCPSAIRA